MTAMKLVTDAFSLYNTDLKDRVAEMMEALGDLDGLEVWGNEVLLGVFCREARTKGGLFVGAIGKEDVWQGKVGMILKIGPDAFPEDSKTFNGRKPAVGDFVYHNINETTIQHFYCGPGSKMREHNIGTDKHPDTKRLRDWEGWPIRLVNDRRIYGRITRPETIL